MVIALLLLAISEPPAASAGVDRLLENCAIRMEEASRAANYSIVTDYVRTVARDPSRRDEVIACAAYVRGVSDAEKLKKAFVAARVSQASPIVARRKEDFAAAAPSGSTSTSGAKDLCWQDYCPCDPPQGGSDAGLCRMFRAGMDIDERMLAAAAMARDARRELQEFEARHGKN